MNDFDYVSSLLWNKTVQDASQSIDDDLTIFVLPHIYHGVGIILHPVWSTLWDELDQKRGLLWVK